MTQLYPEFTVEFFERVKNNDLTSVETFCTRTREIILGKIKYKFPSLEKDAEDLAQDGTMNKLQAVQLGNFDPMKGKSKLPDKNYLGWVKTNARNAALNLLEKAGEKTKSMPEDDRLGELFPVFLSPTESELEEGRHEIYACLQRALASDDLEVLAIALRNIDARAVTKAIAIEMGITEGAANSRYNRAKEQAKLILDQNGYDLSWVLPFTEPYERNIGRSRKSYSIGFHDEDNADQPNPCPENKGEGGDENDRSESN